MPEINIAITLDRNYIQHAAVMLYSLIQANKEHKIKVFAICDEKVTAGDWDKISAVYNNTNLSVERIIIDPQQFSGFKISVHASAANYYRIQMAELLSPAIEKILYLDADIVVLEDISTLYNTDIEAYYFAAVEDPDNPAKYTLGLKKDEPYLNSGVMLINLAAWRKDILYLKLRDFILNNESIIQYWDQDAFNAVCKGRWKALPPRYNLQTAMFTCSTDAVTYTQADMQQAIARPVILHYTGKTKPWDYMSFHPRKKLYYKYLCQTPWKDYMPPDKTIGNFFRKYKLMPSLVEKIIQSR